MKPNTLVTLAALCALFAGCATTRSISNSGYEAGPPVRTHHHGPHGPAGPGQSYRGELSEFDVIGIDPDTMATEDEIRRALQNTQPVRLARGSSVLLIQSGAAFPDGPMASELGRHFNVLPFSGVPRGRELKPNEYATPEPAGGGYSRSLRLAAARGGAQTIICYWGILESAREHLETKTISWVPVVNWFVPDERQHMRLKLKVAVIDVTTGRWTLLSPEPLDDRRLNTSPRRGSSDQRQVETLKQRVYEAAARELLRTCAD